MTVSNPELTSKPLAAQYFDARIVNDDMGINSAESLWEWLKSGAATPLTGRKPPTPTGPTVVYRGQSNSVFGLSSSLFRLCKDAKAGVVTESDLARAESAITASMRSQGLGRRMTDGELLAVLQHHFIPTRLIDVSTSPIEALFFAVDSNEASDGRLFVVDVHDPEPLTLGGNPGDPLPWDGAARGQTQSRGDWTESASIVDVPALDPRMRAQRGKFLVGGLNKRWAGRTMRLDGEDIRPERYTEVSTLAVNFVGQRRESRNQQWPATGWTVLIKKEWKPFLVASLAAEDDKITADTMYPPLNEVKRLAKVVAQDVFKPAN